MAFEDPDKPLRNIPEDKKTDFTFRGQRVVLSKTSGRPFRGLKAMGMEKGIYPEEKRIEAVAIYAATGNIRTTAELSKVSETHLRKWRKEDWFQDLLREIRQENNDKIDVKFTEIVELALDGLKERLINGDHQVLKDGTIVRKPISARDLSIVSAINVDKRQLLRGEATSRSESVGRVEDKAVDRLEKLAETFENLARFGRQPKIIEVTPDAVQITGPESLPVCDAPEDREGIPSSHAEGEEAAQESEQEKVKNA